MRVPDFSRLSVVIPAFNESCSITAVVTGLRTTLGSGAQIIVVDDGSADDTGELASAAGAQLIVMPGNSGKGRALAAGFQAATGDFVVTIDADGQDDPGETPALLARGEAGADLVIGSRFLGRFHPGSISPLNKFATRGFNTLIFLLYGVAVTDSQAGFRCFRRELLTRLPIGAGEYEVETEMLVRAIRAGARVAEVPVLRFQRRGGTTSFNRIRHGLRILSTILRNRLP
jgi:glycosyltransferase involved in cell wall biosynthesis